MLFDILENNNMATYGSGQMLGSGINPESFKQDYSGFSRAAEIQAQGLSNLGGSIAGAIKDYGEAKQERKKLDAGIKATVTGIESAIKMGDSLGIDVKSSLTPYLDKINDPNVTPTEAAAYAQEASSAISNILNFGMKANQLGMEENQNIRAAMIKQAQMDAEANKPGSIVTIAVPGGTQQMIVNPQTGILEPIKIAENINTALNLPSTQGNQQFLDGNGTAMDGAPGVLPSINDPMNAAAEAIAYANRMTGGRNDISNLSPVQTGVPASQPPQALRIDSLPSVAMPTTLETPFGFTPAKAEETYRSFTPEEIAIYGSNGQVSSTGKVYPIRPATGTEFTVNPDGSTTYRQGAGVGAKEEKQKMAKENATDKAIALTSDLNFLSDKAKLMAPGTVGALGRMFAEKIPATDQAENKQVIDRVRASLTLENLQAMRNSNPTGASLGTVSDKDTSLVADSATALSNAQSPEAFQKELVRLKNLQHDIIYGSERVLKNKLEKGEIKQSDFDNAMANAPAEYIDANGVIKSREIKPTAPSSDSESLYERYLRK
jgi:hypothetical protein